jgi:hypothetical protein
MVGDPLITENLFFCKLEMLYSNFDLQLHTNKLRGAYMYIGRHVYICIMHV